MAIPRGPARTPRRRPSAPSIRPSQVLVLLAVLALFVVGLVVGGVAGAVIVGAMSVAAGVWLTMRWGALDHRVRIFRAGVVVIGIAVALSLLAR